MKNLFVITLMLTSTLTFGQDKVVIMPKPVSLEMHSGNFNLNAKTIIIANKTVQHDAEMLNVYLKKLYGFTLPVKNIPPGKNVKNAIILGLLKPGERKKDEYDLTVKANEISIGGVSNEAIFYGIQT